MSMPNRFCVIERRLDTIEKKLGTINSDSQLNKQVLPGVPKGCGKAIMARDGQGQHESFCGCTYRGLHLCDECDSLHAWTETFIKQGII